MKTILLIVGCALQVLPAAAQAQQAAGPRVAVEISALREVKEKKDGKAVTRLEPAGKALSGETIVYAVAYRNEGDAPARNAVITDPLPKGVVCLPKTALSSEAEAEFSADGGGTWGQLPLIKKEKGRDGKTVAKPVPDSAVTHVRWTLRKDLPPGASGEFRFKVKVK